MYNYKIKIDIFLLIKYDVKKMNDSDDDQLQQKIQELFKNITSDNKTYPSDWKHLAIDLQMISNSDSSPFDNDATSGFNYLGIVVMNTICDKCNDKKAFIWLKKFAHAWLDNTELPKFPMSCFYSEGMYSDE